MLFSFRATLFTLMLAVLFTAVALLGGAAYYYSRFAVENLGNQVLAQVSARVEQHIQNALDVAEDEAVVVADLIERVTLRAEQVADPRVTRFLKCLDPNSGDPHVRFGGGRGGEQSGTPAATPQSERDRCSLVTGRCGHTPRSCLAIQPKALPRDMAGYFNRLLDKGSLTRKAMNIAGMPGFQLF